MATKKVRTPVIEPRLLTIKDAAAYLSATVWFLRTLAWEKKIAFVRLGKRLLFDRKDLDAFVDRMKTRPA